MSQFTLRVSRKFGPIVSLVALSTAGIAVSTTYSTASTATVVDSTDELTATTHGKDTTGWD